MVKKGFTLVELSIVLVIIGLLIGGILVAQSMIETAKLSSFIRDIRQYEIATNNYRSAFRYFPGDDPKALEKFGSACVNQGAGSINKCNGNGDGLLVDAPDDSAGYGYETIKIWEHLYLSKMLVTPYEMQHAPSNNSAPIPTVNSPLSSLGPDVGIKMAYFASANYFNNLRPANYIYILMANTYSTGILKPGFAMALDAKLDDGNPAGGNVFASGTVSGNPAYDGNCIPMPWEGPPWNYKTEYKQNLHGCQLLIKAEVY